MDLLSRWRDLWQRFGILSPPEPIFEELACRYGEPQRAYHTLEHIQDCLLQFDQVRDQAERADEIEMALWCHDAIYDPQATDNELQSAAWAEKILIEGNLAVDVVARVRDLILATQHRASLQKRIAPDAALMVDIDLSILGRLPSEFDRYNAAVRREYQWVPEPTYRAARATVLESFLARPAIYQTAWFHERYEAPARENLTRTMRILRKS